MAYGLRIINDDSELLIDSDYVNPTFVQKLEFNATPTFTEAGVAGSGSFVNLHTDYIRRDYSTSTASLNTGTYIVLWRLPDNGNIDVWYNFPTSTMEASGSLTCQVYANSTGSALSYLLPTAYIFATNASALATLYTEGPALRMYNSSNQKTFDSTFTQLVPYDIKDSFTVPGAGENPASIILNTPSSSIYLLPRVSVLFSVDAYNAANKVDQVVFDTMFRRLTSTIYAKTLSSYATRVDGSNASSYGNPNLIFAAGNLSNLSVLVADADLYQTASPSTGGGTNPAFTLTRSVISVNEGSTFTITLTITNATVPNGTTYGYNVTGVQGSLDYTASASSFIVNNNTAAVTFTVLNDALTEGTETFTLELTTYPYPTISVNINDTSITALPTYSISPQTSSVNEGGSITFTVTTTQVPNGTTLYWAYNGGSSDPVADFNAYNGSFTISGNSGTFTVYPKADLLTEGSETFAVGVRTGSTTGTEVATTGTITINDTSLTAPAYSFTSQQNVTETQTGNSIATFTFTNVISKTVTFAIVAPSTGTAATSGTDVTINITSMSINGSGSRDVSYYPAADQITEGTEYFRITATVDGSVVATTGNISISDTSTTPAGTLISQSCAAYGVYPYTLNKVYADGNGGTYTESTFNSPTCGYVAPSYSWATSPLSVNEGATSSLNFNYTNAPPNTSFTFNFQPPTTGTSASVPADGSLNTSSFTTAATTSSGSVSVSYSITADSLTEGTESFRIQAIVGGSTTYNSGNITINDTSTTPPATYTLTAGASSVNEGSSVTFTAGGTNIPNGTYYWTITNSGDFGTTSGSFTISGNSGSFSVSPTADATTEGSETFTATIRDASFTALATSGSVTINDTSTTPVAVAPTITSVVIQQSRFYSGENVAAVINFSGPITADTYINIRIDAGGFGTLYYPSISGAAQSGTTGAYGDYITWYVGTYSAYYNGPVNPGGFSPPQTGCRLYAKAVTAGGVERQAYVSSLAFTLDGGMAP
jgi:hypothetical protein